MFVVDAFLWGLATVLLAAVLTWLNSLIKQDVSIGDTWWPLIFIIAAFVLVTVVSNPGPRTTLLLILVTCEGCAWWSIVAPLLMSFFCRRYPAWPCWNKTSANAGRPIVITWCGLTPFFRAHPNSS